MFWIVQYDPDNSEAEADPLFDAIVNAEPDYSLPCFKNTSKACLDLIQKFLVKNPEERISIQEALSH